MDYKKVEKDIVNIILQHQAFRRLSKYENIAKIIANDVTNYIKSLIEKEFKSVEKNTNRNFLGYLGRVIKATKNMNKDK